MLLRTAGLMAQSNIDKKKKKQLKALDKIPKKSYFPGTSREESYELSQDLEEEMFMAEGGGFLGEQF